MEDKQPEIISNELYALATSAVTPPIKSTSLVKIKEEYEVDFAKCLIFPKLQVDNLIERIVENRKVYESLKIVPWWWIGPVHNLESSLSFKKHLHNGDPLTRRTVNVPSGRPKVAPDTSNGYSWSLSALDALTIKGLDIWKDWSVSGALYQFERYNGWGYRRFHSNNSPYLWSGSQYWTRGKYVKDSKYDPKAGSSQLGAAVVLRRMVEKGLVKF